MNVHGFNPCNKITQHKVVLTLLVGQVTEVVVVISINGCIPFMPAGIGGQGPRPCDGVRDHAHRGGLGLIRIKFVSSTNDYDLDSAIRKDKE